MMIAGFPKDFAAFRPQKPFRDLMQGRWWLWIDRMQATVEALPDRWVVAYRDWDCDWLLVVKEPAGRFVSFWCWFWTRGRWSFHLLARKIGAFDPEPGVMLPSGRWFWPWEWGNADERRRTYWSRTL